MKELIGTAISLFIFMVIVGIILYIIISSYEDAQAERIQKGWKELEENYRNHTDPKIVGERRAHEFVDELEALVGNIIDDSICVTDASYSCGCILCMYGFAISEDKKYLAISGEYGNNKILINKIKNFEFVNNLVGETLIFHCVNNKDYEIECAFNVDVDPKALFADKLEKYGIKEKTE